MDCIVHGVAKSQTGLSDFHFHFSEIRESLEKIKHSYQTPLVPKDIPSWFLRITVLDNILQLKMNTLKIIIIKKYCPAQLF